MNNAKTPPFPIEDEINAAEETRLRYRYLDLRRPKPHRNLALRHKVLLEIRKTMDEMGFLEIETPMLTRSTPEGARDFLVPSRVHHGQFYALPQSPQIFKQILMIGGLDRYFQIVKCFRDEDQRADRQLEFTQLDVEMSFPRQEDIFHVLEQVMIRACAVAGVKATAPFPHMLYKDAIRKYGSDKPDMRFGMELHEVTDCFPQEAKEKLQIEGNVFAFAAPGAASYSRKQLDELTEKAKSAGAKGAYFVKLAAEGTTSTVEKLIGPENVAKLTKSCEAKTGGLVVAVSAKTQIKGTEAAALVAGQLRLQLGEALNQIDKTQWKFLWLTGFPLFEWSESEKAWVSAQHPFTGIVDEDLEKLETAPWEVRSKGYDLVLNGVELGSGSIRIHRQDIPIPPLQSPRPDRRANPPPLRFLPRCPDVRHTAPRRNRPRPGPRSDAPGQRKEHPRSNRVRKDNSRPRPDGRVPIHRRQRPTRPIRHNHQARRSQRSNVSQSGAH